RLGDRGGIRGITGVGSGIGELLGQLAREVGAPREQRDGHSLVREGARQRGAVPFPDPDHGTYGFAHDGSHAGSVRRRGLMRASRLALVRPWRLTRFYAS